MGQLVDTLGNKSHGQLVRAQDWDALVLAVETGDTTLDGKITAAETASQTRDTALDGRITAAENASQTRDTALDGKITAAETASQTRDTALGARIDELPLGTCTVHARPGHDLQARLNLLPATGGELCLGAGTYELNSPLWVLNRQRVVISGAGFATVIRAGLSDAAIVVSRCSEVELRGLRVEGGSERRTLETFDPPEHHNGAVTLLGSTDVVVTDCTLVCRTAPSRRHACLVARSLDGVRPDGIRIERSRLEIGARQIGMLVVDPLSVVIAGNRVRLDPSARPAVVQPAVRPLSIDPLGGRTSLAILRRPIIPRAPEAFAEQGIVVGGGAVGTVQILDNVVVDVAQGIHVGVSRAAPVGSPPVLAERVVIARNVVRCYVPGDYRRERHAVFVGNVRSLQVSDTTADVRRNVVLVPTPLEGIRLHGTFGPYVAVRGSSLSGFSVGVRVVPLLPVQDATWSVSETQAEGAALAVEAPATVEQLRNHPAPPPVPVPGAPTAIVLEPAVAVKASGAEHQVVATVRDLNGLLVPGALVRFVPDSGDAKSVETDARGIAEFKYAGTVPGVETVTAFVDRNATGKQEPGEPFATATVNFLSAEPASIVFTTNALGATIGSAATLTAIVRDASQRPLKEKEVVFAVTGANNNIASKKITTDADGAARFTYEGRETGADRVTATLDKLQATTSVVYARPDVARIMLEAPGSVAAGGEVSVYVKVLSQAGTPVPAMLWRIVNGANNAGDRLDIGADGTGRFQYIAGNAGQDTVIVYVSADANNRSLPKDKAPSARIGVQVIAPVENRVLVPDLREKTQEAAVAALREARLNPGGVKTLFDPPLAVGDPVVIEQKPVHGTQVVPGTLVEVTLQRRSRPVNTYELVAVGAIGFTPGRSNPVAIPVLNTDLTPRSGPVH